MKELAKTSKANIKERKLFEILSKSKEGKEEISAVSLLAQLNNKDATITEINDFIKEKIKETLVDGVGLNVFAVSDENTLFSTLKVSDVGELQNYVYLAAGWNILVEVGIYLGINLDKAERIRKVRQ